MTGTQAGQGGAFITFEGGEGAGKSTQIGRLAARLAQAGAVPVVTTREPGGSPKAEEIRAVLLAGAVKRHGPFAEALLFSAARIDHLDTLIRPALARGETVLCDRFSDSTFAYQGAAGGLEPELLRTLERVVVVGTVPDLTLVLDLDPAIGLARAKARAGAGEGADRFEAEALGFHTRLRAAFLAIAAAEPGRCVVIDAGRPPDAVEEAVAAAVAARLPRLLAPEAGDDAA